MSPEMEENEKIADVLAAAIREAARLAGEDARSFVAVVEKTGDALVEKAEGTALELRGVVERMKERMRTEMGQLAEEIEKRSDALAEEAARYIRHCAESRETILGHHRRLNGTTPQISAAAAERDAEIEREMKTIVRSRFVPGEKIASPRKEKENEPRKNEEGL